MDAIHALVGLGFGGSLISIFARSALVPLRAVAAAPPSGCTYITGGTPYARWPYNTGSSPGQVQIFAENDGDSSLSGGGFTEVQNAIGMWMGIANTSWNFTYGGSTNYPASTLCAPPPTPTPTPDLHTPSFGTNIVIFNDPCSDIPDLSGCSGTLGFGGPWYVGTHSFDGSSWYSISSLFVVVNNVAGCMGSTNYQRMLAHEMGHGD